MTHTGGCRCGAIRYRVDGQPAHSALCHCADCRRSAGAPMVGWALFPRERVAIEGTPVTYESSPGTFRQFCGTCGTGLFFVNEAVFPDQIDIQFATLDDPDALPPQARIQTAEAAAWFARFGELPAFERFPAE
ncbi:GFA family protein [Antarcticirhabdus aurantiaca]|uniref:GFA family protein n=1 Tax=Antarcticirhabdus aurantiaca TaxID=2606717 RepID=A0ACD4NRD6_9HYPH|nr:GFA family protein [Antarcticirhabdus aurantiaca]WAJ29262.1 GFA family protein [Jeongeuplla avenae]